MIQFHCWVPLTVCLKKKTTRDNAVNTFGKVTSEQEIDYYMCHMSTSCSGDLVSCQFSSDLCTRKTTRNWYRLKDASWLMAMWCKETSISCLKDSVTVHVNEDDFLQLYSRLPTGNRFPHVPHVNFLDGGLDKLSVSF